MANRVINFSAGPSALPLSVLEEAAQGLLDFDGTGIGIAEISHRSKEFGAFVNELESLIRAQLKVPPSHHILFTQGGGSLQFSAVVLNLLARHCLLHPGLKPEQRVLDYVVTGTWSERGATEARRLARGVGIVNVVADSRNTPGTAPGKFDNIPPHNAYTFSDDPALIFYCENETIDGVQFSHEPDSPASFPWGLLPKRPRIPLVGDFSSSFMSRPIPRLEEYAVIFAGAQKNIGPAGLTILIVREDCLVDVDKASVEGGAPPTPLTMSYKLLADKRSLYNTPSVFSMYVANLVLRRTRDLGGLEYFERVNRRKAEKVYEVLREGEEEGVLKVKVVEGSGSWMNVVFDVIGEGAEARFIAGAEKSGMKGLKGHRSVGGIRVSLYNAVTEDQTNAVVAYIRRFIAYPSK